MKNVVVAVTVSLNLALVVVLIVVLSGKDVPSGLNELLGALGMALGEALVAKAKGASTREITPPPTR